MANPSQPTQDAFGEVLNLYTQQELSKSPRRVRTDTSPWKMIKDNPSASIGVGAGAILTGRAMKAEFNMVKEAMETMRKSAQAEAEAVKILKARGLDVEAVTPKAGQKGFRGTARALAGERFTEGVSAQSAGSATARATPKVRVFEGTQVPYTNEAGAPTQTVRTGKSIYVDAKKATELATKKGVGKGSMYANESLAGLKGAEITMPKAPTGFANSRIGSRLWNIRSGMNSPYVIGPSAVLEGGAAAYDVLGSQGIFMDEYNRSRDAMEEAMRWTGYSPVYDAMPFVSATLASGKRIGKGASDAILFGTPSASGIWESQDRAELYQKATELFMSEKAKMTGDSLSYPVVPIGKSGSVQFNMPKGSEFAPDTDSPMFKQILLNLYSQKGIPSSWATPSEYEGPNLRYDVDAKGKVRGMDLEGSASAQDRRIRFATEGIPMYSGFDPMASIRGY